MKQSPDPVRERQTMLAGMTPVLKEGTYFFCSTADPALASTLTADSLACFREDEGITLVLEQGSAIRHGFDLSLPMRRIVLEVFSALDGVGLTAAVATALADAAIPCNMIAAYHHDHVFVPAHRADQALGILKGLQQSAQTAA